MSVETGCIREEIGAWCSCRDCEQHYHEPYPKVFEGVEISGEVNTPDTTLIAQVAASIRRGHPQLWPVAPHGKRVAIVGGGPSLETTLHELRDLVFQGVEVVALNGAYQWLIDRNIRPNAQIVLDARPSTARFVDPCVPTCRYYLCSQCAPETWDAVEGRPWVGIWHAGDDAFRPVLDAYYLGKWVSVTGGTTVGTRAIGLLRMLGYLRMDLFGLDSCWVGDQHHAYAQDENDRDRCVRVTVTPQANPGAARDFWVAPWMLKQLEDFVLLIRTSGNKFLLQVHGDGLLAFALQSHAAVTYTTKES